MRRLSMLICAILVFVISGSAFALDTIHWTGKGGDDLWKNPKNWDKERVPQFGDEVVIDSPDAPQPRFTADATTDKPVVFIAVGYFGTSGALTIEGGKLECNCGLVGVKAKKKGRWEILGVKPAKATMNMKGGTLTMLGKNTSGDPVCDGGLLQWGRPNAEATFNMTGGEINLGLLQIPASEVNSVGTFNLDGGVINVTNPSDNEAGLFIGENKDRDKKFKGVMNISGGKLILEGDATALINKYIADKAIVPYPAKDAAKFKKSIVVDFDKTNKGKTTVTAEAVEIGGATAKPAETNQAAPAEKK